MFTMIEPLNNDFCITGIYQPFKTEKYVVILYLVRKKKILVSTLINDKDIKIYVPILGPEGVTVCKTCSCRKSK